MVQPSTGRGHRLDRALKFEPYDGDLMGLYVDENHHVIKWTGPGTILFSLSRRGNAISAHFASDKQGLRHLKQAIEDCFHHVVWAFDWCTMVLAQVKSPSVGRLVEKCDFVPIATAGEYTIYMRQKDGRSSR